MTRDLAPGHRRSKYLFNRFVKSEEDEEGSPTRENSMNWHPKSHCKGVFHEGCSGVRPDARLHKTERTKKTHRKTKVRQEHHPKPPFNVIHPSMLHFIVQSQECKG